VGVKPAINPGDQLWVLIPDWSWQNFYKLFAAALETSGAFKFCSGRIQATGKRMGHFHTWSDGLTGERHLSKLSPCFFESKVVYCLQPSSFDDAITHFGNFRPLMGMDDTAETSKRQKLKPAYLSRPARLSQSFWLLAAYWLPTAVEIPGISRWEWALPSLTVLLVCIRALQTNSTNIAKNALTSGACRVRSWWLRHGKFKKACSHRYQLQLPSNSFMVAASRIAYRYDYRCLDAVHCAKPAAFTKNARSDGRPWLKGSRSRQSRSSVTWTPGIPMATVTLIVGTVWKGNAKSKSLLNCAVWYHTGLPRYHLLRWCRTRRVI